ncbi:hypothetical protein PM082_014782 [Marasmius tenuissimus]|nr:hypothetical protein PM082_014782 [Marasmius tenuissimus]
MVSVPTETAKPRTPKPVKVAVSPRLAETLTRSTRPGAIRDAAADPNDRTEGYGPTRGKDSKIGHLTTYSISASASKPAAVTGKEAIGLPNSSEKQGLSGVFTPNEPATAKTPKTVKVPVSPRSTDTPTHSTRLQAATVASDLRREIRTTEKQAMGSAGARTTKPVPRKPTSSQHSQSAEKLRTVPNQTAKQPKAEQESANTTESTKHVPTKFSSVASRATHSQRTRKIDGVNKAWR